MLHLNYLRHHLDVCVSSLARRGYVFDKCNFLKIDSEFRLLQKELQELQSMRNKVAKEVGVAKSKGQSIEEALSRVQDVGDRIQAVQTKLHKKKQALDDLLYGIPNLLDDTVPDGNSEEDNQKIRSFGKPKDDLFKAKDHVDLTSADGGMDFQAAASLSGSRFVVLSGSIAKLHRALAQFMLDVHIHEHDYEEKYLPYLVGEEALLGTGQLPKFEEDQFVTEGDRRLYLLPTAEVALTNLVRKKILKEQDLPLKWVAHTPCFRKEAGSYGKDTRGMLRQHQFDKVELVQIVMPEASKAALEALTHHAEVILKKLDLPYRVMNLCSADVGFSAKKTYDIEVWMPGQKAYREISSCSLCGDFQARRMQARFRRKGSEKIDFVHTLNGSGVAVGRALIAVLENYQDEDGSICIPAVLRPYLQGLKRIDAISV